MDNFSTLAQSFTQESKFFFIDIFKRRYSETITKTNRGYLNKLKTNGFVTIPNFLDKNVCDDIIKAIDEEIDKNPNIWRDEKGSDKRIYFFDRKNDQVKKFFQDDFVLGILKNYEKSGDFSGFTLANKLISIFDNKGSGGGWHRDFTKRKQTKAILYLSDVGEENGPFQFVEKSHLRKNIFKSISKYGYGHNQNRFEEKEIEMQDDVVRTITGKAGSLLLVDTRGLHRGKPIENGTRYAMTNYYWFNSRIPSHIKALNPFQ